MYVLITKKVHVQQLWLSMVPKLGVNLSSARGVKKILAVKLGVKVGVKIMEVVGVKIMVGLEIICKGTTWDPLMPIMGTKGVKVDPKGVKCSTTNLSNNNSTMVTLSKLCITLKAT